jgi:hypothetical protein
MTFPLRPAVERRRYYRLSYPTQLAPEIVILGITFRVLDISEKAIRFRKDFSTRMDTGMTVQGVVIYSQGGEPGSRGNFLKKPSLSKDHVRTTLYPEKHLISYH